MHHGALFGTDENRQPPGLDQAPGMDGDVAGGEGPVSASGSTGAPPDSTWCSIRPLSTSVREKTSS